MATPPAEPSHPKPPALELRAASNQEVNRLYCCEIGDELKALEEETKGPGWGKDYDQKTATRLKNISWKAYRLGHMILYKTRGQHHRVAETPAPSKKKLAEEEAKLKAKRLASIETLKAEIVERIKKLNADIKQLNDDLALPAEQMVEKYAVKPRKLDVGREVLTRPNLDTEILAPLYRSHEMFFVNDFLLEESLQQEMNKLGMED